MLTAAIASGQQPITVTEFDPGLLVGFELNRHLRLDFGTGRENSENIGSAKWKFTAGASLRTKPLFKMLADEPDADKQHVLVVGSAYEYSRASENGNETIEHRIMLDGTARYAFAGSYLLTDRNRIEFRWVNGEYRFRYRNRLMFERSLKVKSFKFTPYTWTEAYWDKKYEKWNQFRFAGGAQFPFRRRMSLDVFYERSHCTTCANPNTNIFGATLSIFFRRRK